MCLLSPWHLPVLQVMLSNSCDYLVLQVQPEGPGFVSKFLGVGVPG